MALAVAGLEVVGREVSNMDTTDADCRLLLHPFHRYLYLYLHLNLYHLSTYIVYSILYNTSLFFCALSRYGDSTHGPWT